MSNADESSWKESRDEDIKRYGTVSNAKWSKSSQGIETEFGTSTSISHLKHEHNIALEKSTTLALNAQTS